MYISDESTDALIITNVKVRDAVEGKSVMLWLPGQGAGVSVNMLLMFGWMGIAISIYRMLPGLRHSMGWLALGIGAVSAITGVHWFMVVRGLRTARMRMYRHALLTVTGASLATAIAMVRHDMAAAALAGAGTLFALTAMRLIAGPSYALFAAFYRAKRAYESADPAQ